MRTPTPLLQTSITLACLALFSTPERVNASNAQGESSPCLVHWQRKSFEPGQWPAELPARAQTLISHWRPWAEEMEYRMDFDPHMRVMTLSSSRHNRSVCMEDKLVQRVLTAFDISLPAVHYTRSTSDDTLPEPKRTEDPVVLLRLHNRADYLSALDYLGTRYPHLSAWTRIHEQASGFIADDPICAGWIENGVDKDLWRVDNELVHRLTANLCQARFGSIPHWLERAIAWNMEETLVHSIHCFPHRSDEHVRDQQREWQELLKTQWKDRAPGALALEDMSLWQHGSYESTQAGMAFGLVSYLQKHHEGALAPVLHDLGVYNRSQLGPAPLEQAAAHVPAPVTTSIIRRHAGPDALVKVTEFFSQGRRYGR